MKIRKLPVAVALYPGFPMFFNIEKTCTRVQQVVL